MAEIHVNMSPDGLQADIQVEMTGDGEYPGVQSLVHSLVQKGIKAGIDKEVLTRMYEQRIRGKRLVAAKGKAAAPGNDARLELLVDASSQGTPLVLENGRVDHKELQNILNVRKGTPLVRRIPPRDGIPGISIMGERIEAPPSKDIKITPGAGVMVSKDDQNTLVAAKSGALVIGAGGVVSVVGTRVISGDVDYGTGNVSFNGDLQIKGTVRSGFRVQVEGNLTVGGSIEDAQVECVGDCHVSGGVVGGSFGKVICGGSFFAHHGENCRVDAKRDITFAGDCIHGTICTEGSFCAKAILGGRIEAAGGVTARTIGGATETKTVINIGAHAELIKQGMVQIKKLGHLATDIQALKDELYLIVRNGMNDAGELRQDEKTAVADIKSHILEKLHEYNALSETVEKNKMELQQKKTPMVRAQEIQPNTLICYGEIRKTLKTLMTGLQITVKDGKLIFAKV